MATSVPIRLFPAREISLVGLGAATLFLLLAIGSYSPADTAFSYTGQGGEIRNLVGASGAYFADFVLYLFGWVAYSVPLALTLIGVRLVRMGGVNADWLGLSIRASGWFVLIVSSCVLLHLHSAPTNVLPAGNGGVFGQWLVSEGAEIFGWIGMTLLCSAGILMGMQTACGFSWLDVAEKTGFYLHNLTTLCVSFYDKYYDRLRQRREQQKVQRIDIASRVEARKTSLEEDLAKTQRRDTAKVKIVPKVNEKAKGRGQQKRLFDTKSTSELPDPDLLDECEPDTGLGYSADSLEAMSKLLEIKLADFGVEAQVVSVLPGPVITRFELQPAAGVKVQKISALAKDLARSLAVISVRIVEVIPGKSVVGIEIPNEHREMVRLKEVLTSSAFLDATSPLTLALGKDIAGASVVADIAKMPHLLVAGTTGSGKSVGVNAMLLSLLYKSTPEQVRLILVDPKMLELSVYEGIPHLLAPVVTDMREAAHALNWCVAEMERRYKLMAALGVRNLAGFNKQVREAAAKGEPIVDPLWTDELEEAPELTTLPNIVVVIDEFADMMMVVGKKVEQLIARIAQKARAAGIHLILATQRPSVDVITGLIKANIPTRMGFQVSSKIDSRTILDQGGAEQLLGHGDMLYLPPGTALPQRVHGAFVSDEEVHRVVQDWKQRGSPDYLDEIVSGQMEGEPFLQLDSADGDTEQEDELYDEAVQFVLESRRASISAVQRKMRIGYNRAARLIEAMEAAGIVSTMSSNGSREILVPNRD